MITGYKSYVNYFRRLAQRHTVVVDFVVGGAERILNRMRQEIRYPICWLEVPDVTLYEKGGLKAIYNGAFLILANAEKDDWDMEETDLDVCLQACYDFINQMVEDAEEELFDMDLKSISVTHKGKWSSDNDWGWRVEFEIIALIDCLTEEAFEED